MRYRVRNTERIKGTGLGNAREDLKCKLPLFFLPLLLFFVTPEYKVHQNPYLNCYLMLSLRIKLIVSLFNSCNVGDVMFTSWKYLVTTPSLPPASNELSV